jgi:hypothetical protein
MPEVVAAGFGATGRRRGLSLVFSRPDHDEKAPWTLNASPADRVALGEIHPALMLYRLAVSEPNTTAFRSVGAWARDHWRVTPDVGDDLARRRRAVLDAYAARYPRARPATVTITVDRQWSWLLMGVGADATPSGFAFPFDTTTGAPLLPASALRGVARRGTDDDARLFGSPPDTAAGAEEQGVVGILDGIPGGDVRLDVDVLTAHHPHFPTGGLPDGLADPIPVELLGVAAGTFSAAVVPTSDETSDEDIDAAAEAIKWAVEQLGFGARTSTGYGAARVEVTR